MTFKHHCYIDLVKTSLDKIASGTDRADPAVNEDDEVDTINALINVIKHKNVQTKCKWLFQNTMGTDFPSAKKDEATMNTARQAVENKIPHERALNEWRENLHNFNSVKE